MKTLGWELWEQLGFKAPDALVVAVGLGNSLLGSFYAFRGLVEAAARSTGCSAPLRRPGGGHRPDPRRVPGAADDIAGVVRAGRSPRASLLAGRSGAARSSRLCERSGGGTAIASEEEILAAQRDLAAEGLYVEPTAALTLAAARSLLSSGQLRPTRRTS